MSYCRIGKDSEIYLFKDFGGIYNLYIDLAARNRIKGASIRAETFDNLFSLRARLWELDEQGVKIPERALIRIHCEIIEILDN